MQGLPTKMMDRIDEILAQLRRMTEAECVMLADIGGQVIGVQGELEQSDPPLVAALAAGDMAAMGELSRRIGEPTPCGTILHEGTHKSIYLLNVANRFLLIVIFRTEMLVGIVRLFTGRAAEKLQELIGEYGETLGRLAAPPDVDFGTALAGELERAFGEPWMER